MKLSNFRLIEVIGDSPINYKFRVEVDVAYGFFNRKHKTREIFREYACHWFFSDNGKPTPGFQAERLANVYNAKNTNSLDGVRL